MSDDGGGAGEGARITSDAALSFWAEHSGSAGDRAWREWSRSLARRKASP